MARRGQIWISAVLFILIITLVLVLVLEAITPVIEGLRDKAVFKRTQDTLLGVNQQIRDVSREGQGSQRLVPVNIQRGKLEIMPDTIKWSLQTEADIIEPRAVLKVGDLMLVSAGDVDSYETANTIVLENSLVKFIFNKTGTSQSFASINTSSILINGSFKSGSGVTTIISPFSFSINDDPATKTGTGYTRLLDSGRGLGSARVKTHINGTAVYDLIFTLESHTDYLKVKAENILS